MGQGRIAEGSVAWLFQRYREQGRFTKNKAKTRKDNKPLMDMPVAFEAKAGQPQLGKRMASKVDATVADKLYQKDESTNRLPMPSGDKSNFVGRPCRNMSAERCSGTEKSFIFKVDGGRTWARTNGAYRGLSANVDGPNPRIMWHIRYLC
ncbi:hypothetical protein HMP09_1246 [Sphingomonas sp. HMP9]|uniref:hypothetical protein n=1 Tax=Sphingomonas sp. HMP9 TaxID=1517554 RepID=UPI0015970811|nr:hypothetical protein [Sphingomonas sp. HMP9]BCA62012.1 hypothetical protein HMP09_1246 [Sphingomonas sp. HMP9]